MEGNEEDILSKAADWKSLLLLHIKLNKTQATQIRNTMQSLSTFIEILGSIPEVKKKKICINQRLANIFAYWKEFE